ncbi:MAG TPA: DUF5777 family beta-barrel protein [Phnomibacter sp.]|nr:DUF5777 family beta-barrel protein [Phnomibacter sp.]
MKKLLSLFFACCAMLPAAMAQDDLLGELEKEDSAVVKQNITIATFKSTRIINLHSTEITGPKNLQFMIIHHFGEIWNSSEGGNNFGRLFGLNAGFANTYMSFDYSPNRWLNLGLAFAGDATLEGTAKFKLMRQQTGVHEYPVSMAWVSTVRTNFSKSDPAPNDFEWNKYSFLNQLLVSRKFTEDFSLQFTPSWVHYNIVAYGSANSHDIFSLGLGGRYKLTNKTAITFEYSRQLNMYENVIDKTGEIVSYCPNLFSLGYDWDTGGHIFQFFLTNSAFASNIQQLSVNPKKDNLGQWSLGFNLNRSYGLKHAK